MPETFLSDINLALRWGVSRQTVWRWHRLNPEFPRSVKLSSQITRWRMTEIAAWEANRNGARARV